MAERTITSVTETLRDLYNKIDVLEKTIKDINDKLEVLDPPTDEPKLNERVATLEAIIWGSDTNNG